MTLRQLTVGFATAGTGGRAAVALAEDGRILASSTCGVGRRASEGLLPALHELLEQAGRCPADIGHIAATTGPGSFTGVRVGLSTLYGLCRAVGARPVGFSTLRLAAEAAPRQTARVLSAMPAGRGEVYVGLFQRMNDGLVEEEGSPRLLDRQAFLDLVENEEVVLVVEEGFAPPPEDTHYVSEAESRARSAALLAVDAPGDDDALPIPMPLYIRRSWAEEVADAQKEQKNR